MHSAPSPHVSRISDPALLVSAIKGSSLGPFQLSASPAPSLMARMPCQRLCLDYTSVGPAMLFTGVMAEDSYTLVFVTECPDAGHAFNFSVEIEKGYLGCFPPGGVIDARTPAGFTNATLTIPSSYFHAAAAIHFPDIPESLLKSGGQLRLGEAEHAKLRRLVDEIMGLIMDESGWTGPLSLSHQMECDLLEAFFTGLRSGCALSKRAGNAAATQRERHLRRARDYIAAHGHRPVPLEELCGELGLTSRSVQQIFQSLLHVSPVTYLRQHRLQGVRRALQVARPELGAVKSAALDWGFWHLGRFAADYRTLFGESPHETLGSRHDPAA